MNLNKNNSPFSIHTFGNDILRNTSEKINEVNLEVRKLASDMFRTMYDTGYGIGLAAPQIGINKQIIVIDLNSDPLILINPEITFLGNSISSYKEGCLSIPGIFFNIIRPRDIEVSYLNEWGQSCTKKANGMLSRCIQHEIDHLNGILFVDRVNDKSDLSKKFRKHGLNSNLVQSVL